MTPEEDVADPDPEPGPQAEEELKQGSEVPPRPSCPSLGRNDAATRSADQRDGGAAQVEVFSKSSNAWVRATIETLAQLDSGGTAYKVRYISPKTQKATEKTVARSA